MAWVYQGTTWVRTQILPSADTMITQVVSIQYANVNDVKALFTPLVSKESQLVSYQSTNTLIVTDALLRVEEGKYYFSAPRIGHRENEG